MYTKIKAEIADCQANQWGLLNKYKDPQTCYVKGLIPKTHNLTQLYFLGGQEGPFRYQPRGAGWEEVQASQVTCTR